MSIKREVEITANADGYKEVVGRMSQDLKTSFESARDSLDSMTESSSDLAQMLQNDFVAINRSIKDVFSQLAVESEKNTDSTKDRLEYIHREITAGERQLKIEEERLKIAEKLKLQKNLDDAGGDSAEEERARREYRENIQDINSEAELRRLQMRGVREEYNKYKEEHKPDVEREHEESRRKPTKSGPSEITRTAGDLANFGNTTARVMAGALGLAGLFTVSGFLGKMMSEGKALDEARQTTSGLGTKAFVAGQGERYGMKDADLLRYQSQVIQQAGDGQYDVFGNLKLEKGFSQSVGSLGGMTSALRMSDGETAQDATLEMLSLFKRSEKDGLFGVNKGDFSQLAEKIQFQTNMLEQQGQQKDTVSATTNSQILNAFGRAGIDDQRTLNFTNKINSGITDPANDYSNAFVMRSISSRNPEASMLDVMKMKEQGIYGEGVFGGLLEDLRKAFSGDALEMNIAKIFGLKFWEAEKVSKMSTEEAMKIGTNEDIKRTITQKDGKGSAGAAAELDARLSNKFAEKGEAAFQKVDEYMKVYDADGMTGLGKKFAEDIIDGLKEGLKDLKKTVEDFISGKSDASKGVQSATFTAIEKALGIKTDEGRIELGESLAHPSRLFIGLPHEHQPNYDDGDFDGDDEDNKELLWRILANYSKRAVIAQNPSKDGEGSAAYYKRIGPMAEAAMAMTEGEFKISKMSDERVALLLQQLVDLQKQGMAREQAINVIYTTAK